MSKKIRLAVLISGRGTNLQSIIDASNKGLIDAEIAIVISDKKDAYGLIRAKRIISTHFLLVQRIIKTERILIKRL